MAEKTNKKAMKTVPYSIISVFSNSDFNCRGNTSAVVMLEHELPEERFQEIASDFNQPATTFLWPADQPNHYHVRWFAPDDEIGLCGHGSVAAIAHLSNTDIYLHYKSGIVTGSCINEKVYLNIDPIYSQEAEFNSEIEEGLGIKIKSYLSNNNKHIVVVDSEEEVRKMTPDFSLLKKQKPFGYIVTSPGETFDFVSRTIVPKVQQLEDHATGSSHACLTPYWSEELDKKHLKAKQLSKRGGYFECKFENDQVELGAGFYMVARGKLFL